MSTPHPIRRGDIRRLPGTRNRLYRVTVGLIDIWAQDAYTRGQCHALARALNAATGWPIMVLGSPVCEQSRTGRPLDCAPYPDGLCACQPVHLAVRMPDGRFLDIHGPRDLTELVKPGSRVLLGPASPALLAAISGDRPRWPVAIPDVAAIFATTLLRDLATVSQPSGQMIADRDERIAEME
jgi:hypothetical protein